MKLPFSKIQPPKAQIKIDLNLIDMINRNLVSSRCLIIINSSSNYHIHSLSCHRRFPGRRFRHLFGRSPFPCWQFSVSCFLFLPWCTPYPSVLYVYVLFFRIRRSKIYGFFLFKSLIPVIYLFVYFFYEVSGTDSVYCFLCLQVFLFWWVNSFGRT